MSVSGVQTLPAGDLPHFSKYETTSAVEEVTSSKRTGWMVQSPYTEKDHQLDLSTLDFENAVLAEALAGLKSIREDYATAPYAESFNWSDIMTELKRIVAESGEEFKETTFYVVAFRSQIKPSTEYSHLGELDKAAHKEAVNSGGFLKYWFGSPDAELRNLATCLWRSRDDALVGGRGPAHRKAAGATRALYAYWKIDQHRLTIRDNVEGWELAPWNE